MDSPFISFRPKPPAGAQPGGIAPPDFGAGDVVGRRQRAEAARADAASKVLAALGTLRATGADKENGAEVTSQIEYNPSQPPPPLRRQNSTPAEASAALERLIHAEPYDSLKAAFDKFDLDGDGELSAEEVDLALQQVGVHFSPEQVHAFMRMGRTSDEAAPTLSESEFLAMVRRHRRTLTLNSHDTPRGPAMPRRNGGAADANHAAAVPRGRRSSAWAPSGMLGRREGMATVMATVPTAPIVAPGVVSGMEHMPKMGYMRPRPSAASSFDLEASFSEIIGLEPIKDKIRALRDTLVKRRFRLEVGAPLVDVGPLHMVFTGNPGCGKTSIARLVARLLHELGAVRRPAFVEVQRTDLVASHIGQTGPKTREKINEAAGGVLFIDEAYRLTSSSDTGKDFGREALEEIMKDLTTGDPVVIAAGYPDDMKRFLDANEGLRRRFGMTFDFPDFSVDELAQMTLLKIQTLGFRLGDGVDVETVAALIAEHSDAAWRAKQNGGVAERLSRTAMQVQDARLSPTKMTGAQYKQLASQLELSDVTTAAERLRWNY
jgi:hypothetical protein